MPMQRTRLTILLALCFPAAITAHPLVGIGFPRTIEVEPTPDALNINYQLDVNALSVTLSITKIDPEIDISDLTGPRKFYEAFTPRIAAVFADRAFVTLDGEEQPVKVRDYRFEETEEGHIICYVRLTAPWELTPGAEHRVEYRELDFPDDPAQVALPGEVTVSLDVKAVKLIEESTVGPEPGIAAVFSIPEVNVPTPAVAEEESPAPAPPESRTLWQRLHDQGLPILFDSTYGIGFLLLIAAIFGAAHALTPGHGKTMVAAYLVGERGTVLHAIVLGVVTTFTHTGIVIILAAVLYVLYPDTVPADVQTALGIVGGLLIAGLGFWLLLRRLGGQADHVHLFGGHDHDHHHHHHDHSHDHTHTHDHAPAGWGRLVVLGITGGIVPCWDAVALLGIAITANRLWLGVPLLVAFSAGLAAVLVALGIAVVYAKRLGGAKFGEKHWFKALPLISAVLLIIIGLWLCRASLAGPA